MGAHVLDGDFAGQTVSANGIRPSPKLVCRSPNAGFWRPYAHASSLRWPNWNAAIAEQLRLINTCRFRGQAFSRRDLFEELERAALQPLPATRYEFATWKPARVNIDYHVEFDDRYYSVPYELARQAVEVRATANVVEIIHRGRPVASHGRGYGRQRFFTVREHMPAAHRAHLEWTPSKLVTWGGTIGPSVAELMEAIDDRSQVRSTLVVSQLPVEAWHSALAGGDPTLADAILDRLVNTRTACRSLARHCADVSHHPRSDTPVA